MPPSPLIVLSPTLTCIKINGQLNLDMTIPLDSLAALQAIILHANKTATAVQITIGSSTAPI